MTKELNGRQHAVIGALAGMTETCIQQPTIYIKSSIQQQKPVAWSPIVMYRGVGINCLSIAPIVAMQFGINGVLSTALRQHYSQDQLSSLQRIGVAGTAGFASALVGGPAELVMTIQQRSGWSLSSTLSNLSAIHGYGIFKRAMAVTAVRDMIWSASYLALGPVLSSSLHDRFPSIFGDASTASLHERTMASLGGSVVAGLITVYATQPIDTIKTVMQGQLVDIKQRQQLPGFVATFRELVGRGGVKYLYRGTVARGTRLVGAVFILGQARNVYEDLFTQYALLE